jgi:transposase
MCGFMQGMRPIGTPKQLQQRRKQALKLLRRGWRPSQVAQLVGVTSRSLRRWRKAGCSAKSKPRLAHRSPGRPSRLNATQLQHLQQRLACGAPTYGYTADYWSLERVRWLIRKEFGVAYHPSAVWHLLGRMNWSCQKPQRLALQRDEAAIAYWKRYRWPWIKKVADPGRNPYFPRRKWQIAGLSTQAYLGAARANPAGAHQFESSATGELARRAHGQPQSPTTQAAGEAIWVQFDRGPCAQVLVPSVETSPRSDSVDMG